MTRLQSLVVSLQPIKPITITQHMGRAIQYCALSQIFKPYSTELADRLHDSNGVKPYTVSGMFETGTTQAVHGRYDTNKSIWFRVTGIGEDVVNALQGWCQALPAELEIDHDPWRIVAVAQTSDQHPWAAQSDFLDVIRRHRGTISPHRYTFKFAAPTAFRSDSMIKPFPTPAFLIHSLAEKWSAFAPQPLSAHLGMFAQQTMNVETFSGETKRIAMYSAFFNGFIGQVTYRISTANLKDNEHKPDLLRTLTTLADELACEIGMLADYAFFCGVGTKSTTGMGMVRQIEGV